MSTYSALASTRRVPCAMQHYFRQMNPKGRGHTLSQGECQVAFQHWVAYIRGGDCGYPSDVTPMEHLRCPLLWCRETFDSLASMLQHVSECPCLSNAWYWCPYCCRPESFMTSQEPCADAMQHSIQRKDSKLRRAVTFFKHLGLKSGTRHKSHGSTSVHENESFDAWLAKRQRLEMEDTSYEISTCCELADSSSDCHGYGSYSGLEAKEVYEMDAAKMHSSQDLDVLPLYTQDEKSTVQTYELDAEPLIIGVQLKDETSISTNPYTEIATQTKADRHNVEPWEEMLVSPSSIIQNPSTYQSTEPTTSLYGDTVSVSLANSGSDTASVPEVVDHHWCHFTVASPHSGSPLLSGHDGNLCGVVKVSTQSQVEDLRETVRVLNEEWLLRCRSIPELALRASTLSPRSLLDIGVQTLQQVFQGVLPATFDAMFGLAHVACAAAYIVHGDDSSHCWKPLFQHILKLQDLILNRSDAQMFVQLVNLLWCPQDSSAKPYSDNYFLDEPSGTLVPLRRPVVGLEGLLSNRIIGRLHTPTCPPNIAAMTVLQSLKDGAVLQVCSRFLDGVEYAGIQERSNNRPTHLPWYAQNHVTNIEEISKTVIRPLQHCDGIEALHDGIQRTATELNNGSLRSVREVEVSLIANGKSSCLSTQVYKRYLHTVASICDHVMREAGPNWRDRCRATDLDVVLASLVETDNRQRLISRRQPSTNVNAMPDTKQEWPESMRTPLTTESQTLIGSSPSAATSPTFTNGSSPATHPSSTTSPESSFSTSTPSSSSTDTTRCPLCPASFTGSTRDRNSNLRRHMRTTRDHGNAVGLLCTVPGCGAILSRTDNLGKHMRTVHPADTGVVLRRVGARKRRRVTEDDE